MNHTKRLTSLLLALAAAAPMHLLAQALEPSQSGLPESDDPLLVASKPGARVELDDVDAHMLSLPADKRAGFVQKMTRVEGLLENLMLKRQLATKARESGLQNDPLIAKEIELATEQVLANRYVATEAAKRELPNLEAIAKERYDSTPEVYQVPTTLDVRHLIIRREGHGDEEAKTLAQKLRDEFVASGGDFEAFVKQHSEERNAASKGGIIRGLQPGSAVAGFDEAAFALKEPGELSEVVASKFGFHIIQLIERREGRRRTFDEVRPEIVAALTADFQQQTREEVLLPFRKQTPTVNPDNLLALRDRYLPGEEGDLRLRRLEGRPPPANAAAEREEALKERSDDASE